MRWTEDHVASPSPTLPVLRLWNSWGERPGSCWTMTWPWGQQPHAGDDKEKTERQVSGPGWGVHSLYQPWGAYLQITTSWARNTPLLLKLLIFSISGMCAQPCLILCNPMDSSAPDSCVHGISQARILKHVAVSSSGESSWPRDRIHISCVSCISRQILYHWATWETFCYRKPCRILFFFWLCYMACGILVPDQGLNPGHSSETTEC